MPELAPWWVGDGEVREGACLGTLPLRGIGRGEDDGWPFGVGPGEALVRFLIGISTGGDSADDGDDNGERAGGACTRGEG